MCIRDRYYFQNLKVVPRRMYGIDLLLGSELNILNEKGEVDLPQDVLSTLDLTIASMHIDVYKRQLKGYPSWKCITKKITKGYNL